MEVIQPDQPKFIVAWNMDFLIPKHSGILERSEMIKIRSYLYVHIQSV